MWGLDYIAQNQTQILEWSPYYDKYALQLLSWIYEYIMQMMLLSLMSSVMIVDPFVTCIKIYIDTFHV